ncbi:acyl-CoA thioester hydrolase YbgC [bacterium BMS3Abin03]|nr:acyl-CoA thioester hydrolase YbgC [bacterium BMS3Abin03]
MLKHKTNIRVRYADTDQMHYAYYGKYPEYFEVGRTDMMRELNLTYKTIEENGFMMPVHSIYINYKNPAFYDELLEVESLVGKLPEVKVHIDHKIISAERNVLICEGYVDLVFVNRETKKVCRPPEFFLKVIRPFFNKDK